MTTSSKNPTKVLIVDDSSTVRQQLRIALSVAGVTCHEAEDGIVAWAALQSSETFDLAIIDIQMPRLDGLGLAQRIRTSERHRSLPFFMCSSLSPEDVKKSRDIGARGWIVKPFAPKKLILAVCKVLNLPPPNERILLDKISKGEEIADD
jgi:two-component system chemotaxis response regulator CheY